MVPFDPFERLARAVATLTPRQLEALALTLDPDDLAVLEQVVADRVAATWRTDPASMAAFLDDSYRTPPYVRLLSRKFREGIEGTSRRQIWNLPGRYGKSLLGSQWGPTWALDRSEGRAKLILVSYGQELADENADGVRLRLRLYSDVLRCELRADRQQLKRFVTDQGGGLLAAGLDSTIVGFGVNREGALIVDDPFKNWQSAHSEARRDKVFNEFRGSLRNRLDDEAAFILIIHHRVHEDDLTARLIAASADEEDEYGDRWDVTVLPALAVAGDVLGREVGEPLDPERFDVAACRNRAASMGSYLASALEQQQPTAEEGTDIKRSWFRLDSQLPTAPDETLTSWDLKLKDREQGDYVVGQAWWRVGSGAWLVDQMRGQYNHAETANAIALLAARHPEIERHVVEAAGSSDEVIPQLRRALDGYTVDDEMASRLGMNDSERASVEALRRRGLSGLIPHPPRMDKRVRARTYIAPVAEAGDVHMLESADFVPLLLDELASFPNGVHDDQVDAMSQALQRLGKGVVSIARPTGQTPSTRPTALRRPQQSSALRARRTR